MAAQTICISLLKTSSKLFTSSRKIPLSAAYLSGHYKWLFQEKKEGIPIRNTAKIYRF